MFEGLSKRIGRLPGVGWLGLILVIATFIHFAGGFAVFNTANLTAFNEGSYNQTFYNITAGFVQLNASNATGNYTSKVFDAGWTAEWNNVSWVQGAPYGQELPGNQQVETVLGGANMTGNVLLMHFNNGTGENATFVRDWSGLGNNATWSGDATPDSNSGPTTSGKLNGGFMFDGNDILTKNSASGLPLGNNAFTISLWTYSTNPSHQNSDLSSDENLLDWGTESPSKWNLLTWYQGKVYHAFHSNDLQGNTLTSPNTWYHIAVTYDGTTRKIYLNGGLDASANPSSTPDVTGSNLHIGCSVQNTYCTNGTIDEVAIWNRTLSATEILNIYKRGVLKLNLTVRSCNDSVCSSGAWSSPYNTSPQSLSLTNNSYFQYQFFFQTENLSFTPELYNVTIAYTLLNHPPSVSLNAPQNNSFTNQNWVLLNATVLDVDLNNMTVWFYGNGTLLSTSQNQTNGTAVSFNWSSLSNGLYNWTVIANDGLDNSTVTYQYFTVDTIKPLVECSAGTESNGSVKNRNWIFLNVSLTEEHFANVTYVLRNASGVLNQTTYETAVSSINWTNLANNEILYWYNATVYDLAGNSNQTESRYLTLDSVNPLVSYATGTESNNTYVSRNWVYVNVSVTEPNFKNITYRFAANVTTYDSLVTGINFTNYGDGNYSYNVTPCDQADNCNSTETRSIIIDLTKPNLVVQFPVNGTTYRLNSSQASIELNYTSNDTYRRSCWFTNLGSQNQTLTNCQNGTISIPDTVNDHNYTITVYVNDSAGNVNSSQVFFTTDYAQGNMAGTTISVPGTEFASVWFTINSSSTCVNNWCENVSTRLSFNNTACSLQEGYSPSYLKGNINQSNSTNQSWSVKCNAKGVYNFTVNYTIQNGSTQSASQDILVEEPTVYWAKTFDSNKKARSFFAVGETVNITARVKAFGAQTITILNSSGGVAAGNASMLNQSVPTNSTAVWQYSFTPNQTGWYEARIAGTNFSQLFYCGALWQSNWTDAEGNTFPFRIQVNASEPGVIERFFEPVDLRLNFTHYASPESVKVAFYNGSNLVTVPSQLYNKATQGNYVASGNIVFLSSLSASNNWTYFVYYARTGGGVNYSTDLGVTNTSEYVEVQNSELRVVLNRSKGGLVQEAYDKRGSNQNLAGVSPMQFSPELKAGPYVYSAYDLSSPTTELTNGSLKTIYRSFGDVGTMHFNLTYSFYSHAPYFLIESNTTPKATETWRYYKDSIFYIAKGDINRVGLKNTSGTFNQTLAGASDLLGVEWLGFYNDFLSGNGLGEVFLNSQQSQPHTPDVDVYSEDSYNYYERTQYNGSVTPSDYFYSKSAIVFWNGLGSFEKMNETHLKLANPINVSVGTTETYDAQEPVGLTANYSPQNPWDNESVTCYSYWTDNLELDHAIITINSSSFNNQTTQSINVNESWVNYTINASYLEAGWLNCNITVYDLVGLSNSTLVNFSVSDATAPAIASLTNSPNSNASLDPNVQITVTANLTEYTGIGSVVMHYCKFPQSNWNNVSMNLVGSNAYNYSHSSSFTPNSEGIWQYFVSFNDTGGNSNSSGITNLSVYYDWTWAQSPADLGVVSGPLASNISVGNLTINNTGDWMLGFKLTSNWDDTNQIYFNETPQGSTGLTFILEPGNSTIVFVKVTSKSTERSDTITLKLDALNSSAQPDENSTNSTIVSYSSGPFPYVSITQYNVSVIQGDSGIVLKAKIQNKGNETASNTWLALVLPSDWSITSGTLNYSIGELAVDAIAYNQITVSVPESASTGTKTLRALASCSENKSGSVSVSVVVAAKSSNVTLNIPGGGTVSKSEVGAASTSELITKKQELTSEEKEKLLQTEETYELVRGREDNFVLKVENPFDVVLENVSVSVSGFLAKYLQVEPSAVKAIPVKGSFEFRIGIKAPKYFTEGSHYLNFTITGMINRTITTKTANLTSVIRLKEWRLVTLIIHGISKEEALKYLEESKLIAKEMSEKGFNTNEVNLLVSQAEEYLRRREYEKIKSLYETIGIKKEAAFTTLSLLQDVEQKLKEAAQNGISTSQTSRLLLFAKAALERGDFETASKRAEDAKVAYALETTGRFNAMVFARNNWPGLTVALVFAIAALYFIYLGTRFFLLNKRLKSLTEEENILLSLIKETQRECFEQGSLSMEEYLDSMKQFEERLSKVIQDRIRFDTIKANLFKPLKGTRRSLVEERNKLLELIKENQRAYLQAGKIETRVYENRMKSYTTRLAEVEEKLASVEAEKAMKKPWWKIKLW
ncbi:LamG domain-containing protein [Candidatus Micrarchaeota archaeon]|nr:LamG domain-containing protein [Candidatus Micrarchaeota archaeon]